MNKKYRFVGEGMGVPGLPHEVTDEEAAALGMSEILDEAVKNGSYVEVEGQRSKVEGKVERKSSKGDVNDG